MRRRSRREARVTAYKLCSLALQYPDEELLAARGELAAAAAALPHSPAADAIQRFMAWWVPASGLEVAEHYVETFDLKRRCGLYLTFYGLGDRRERGQALLRLRRLYRAAGLPQEGSELPDYLPLMLEFCAHAPDRRGEQLLREQRPALELLRAALHEEGTPYAHPVEAVAQLLGAPASVDRARAARLAAQGPPGEMVGLEPFAPPEVMPGEAMR
ncbi:MAG: nitrate reductase molybdenum cofactor assembly chaperone [Solirubrobacterales bacterium]|nr:nitrate reductase molybdenum cofactor assembly chaperone [Solirubrobacterales bacterium]